MSVFKKMMKVLNIHKVTEGIENRRDVKSLRIVHIILNGRLCTCLFNSKKIRFNHNVHEVLYSIHRYHNYDQERFFLKYLLLYDDIKVRVRISTATFKFKHKKYLINPLEVRQVVS